MIEELMTSPLHRRQDILSRPSAAPRTPGIYAWFFKQAIPEVDITNCRRRDDLILLYVGIAPRAPTASGGTSRSHLAQRLRTHFGGNAAASTLRLSLGCLLGRQLGLTLRRVGSKERRTFTNPGEQILDEWMAENALVTWRPTDHPWLIESELLTSGLSLPLNIDGNPSAEHAATVFAARRLAAQRARDLPVIRDSGGPRRPSIKHSTLA